MKQYKRSFLVFIGLAFATLLAVINYKGQMRPQMMDPAVSLADQIPASLPETSTANQQMAIETQPIAPAQIQPLPPRIIPVQTQKAQTPAWPAERREAPHVMSFIEFLSLSENYKFQGYQSDWQAYRAYRKTVAKSPQIAG